MNRSRLLEAVAANRCLLMTLVVALALRLGLAVAIQEQVDRPPAKLCLISGDAEGYWELAQNIRAGRDYSIYDPPRHVLRVPGFPLLLALSQMLFGENPFAARCLLACVGTAACGLTYCLGRELVDGTTGLIAAAYTALSPTLALFSVLILSETAFAAALLLSLVAIARLVRSPEEQVRGPEERVCRPEESASFLRRIGSSMIAGMLIGLATLVRPTWLYAGSAIALAVTVLGGGRCRGSLSGSLRGMGLNVAALLCGIGVSMAPWTIRNYCVTGHLIPTTLWVGPSLYDGLHPAATGDSDMQFFQDDQLGVRMSEYEVDREYRRRAWEFVVHNPLRTAWLAVKKQQRYWSLFPNAGQFRDLKLQVIVCLTVAPLFAFGIIGLWISRKDFRFVILTAAPVLLFAALHLLFVGSLRYRLPAEYPLSVMAAVGVRGMLAHCKWIPSTPP
jgi:hypothetical protein